MMQIIAHTTRVILFFLAATFAESIKILSFLRATATTPFLSFYTKDYTRVNYGVVFQVCDK